MIKMVCDVCGKDIERLWFSVKKAGREADYGLEVGLSSYHLCSAECLRGLASRVGDDYDAYTEFMLSLKKQ